MRAPLLRIQVLRRFWRRSPLAQSPLNSTSLMPMMLQWMVAAIQVILLKFCYRDCWFPM
jgi:hypothetical protein